MSTVLVRIVEGLKSASVSSGEVASPHVVLWPDEEAVWLEAIQVIAEEYPTLILGDYEAAGQQGPAYWIRYQLVEGDLGPSGLPPLVYLPGVARDDFRAAEDCPDALKPLVELQYRGVFWSQPNGKDWTPAAFLQNRDKGLGVEVVSSAETIEALELTLGHLLDQPVSWLESKQPITAGLLNSLVQPDIEKTLLNWLNEPDKTMKALDNAERNAFLASCRNDFGFDPETDGPIDAAGLLGRRENHWKRVWARFRETPEKYPGVKTALRSAGDAQSEPKQISMEVGGRFDNPEAWPQVNEEEEENLRSELDQLVGKLPSEARSRLIQLEDRHGSRRVWVWAQTGDASLAMALEHLAALAETTSVEPAGSLEELSAWYRDEGHEADGALMRALASVSELQDKALVRRITRHIYLPWVDEVARRFQDSYTEDPGSYVTPAPFDREEGTCLVFSDGLRYDLGIRLVEKLRAVGFDVDLGWHYAALPTITSTAKPALTPVAQQFGTGDGLSPAVVATGTEVRPANLDKALSDAGYQLLDQYDAGNPNGKAWTNAANIDGLGHDRKVELASVLEDQITQLTSRIEMLLDAGWKEVEVVTDHGFLAVPDGLPKVELKSHLVDRRKGRCARLKESGDSGGQPRVRWAWDENVLFAVSRGAACFEEGKEYEHGGLSPQECVVPHLIIRKSAVATEVSVSNVSWSGLRLRVEIEGAASNVDLRTKPVDPGSSLLAEPLQVEKGKATGFVPEPDAEGLSAVVVVLDSEGGLVAQRPTVVGEMDV